MQRTMPLSGSGAEHTATNAAFSSPRQTAALLEEKAAATVDPPLPAGLSRPALKPDMPPVLPSRTSFMVQYKSGTGYLRLASEDRDALLAALAGGTFARAATPAMMATAGVRSAAMRGSPMAKLVATSSEPLRPEILAEDVWPMAFAGAKGARSGRRKLQLQINAELHVSKHEGRLEGLRTLMANWGVRHGELLLVTLRPDGRLLLSRPPDKSNGQLSGSVVGATPPQAQTPMAPTAAAYLCRRRGRLLQLPHEAVVWYFADLAEAALAEAQPVKGLWARAPAPAAAKRVTAAAPQADGDTDRDPERDPDCDPDRDLVELRGVRLCKPKGTGRHLFLEGVRDLMRLWGIPEGGLVQLQRCIEASCSKKDGGSASGPFRLVLAPLRQRPSGPESGQLNQGGRSRRSLDAASLLLQRQACSGRTAAATAAGAANSAAAADAGTVSADEGADGCPSVPGEPLLPAVRQLPVTVQAEAPVEGAASLAATATPLDEPSSLASAGAQEGRPSADLVKPVPAVGAKVTEAAKADLPLAIASRRPSARPCRGPAAVDEAPLVEAAGAILGAAAKAASVAAMAESPAENAAAAVEPADSAGETPPPVAVPVKFEETERDPPAAAAIGSDVSLADCAPTAATKALTVGAPAALAGTIAPAVADLLTTPAAAAAVADLLTTSAAVAGPPLADTAEDMDLAEADASVVAVPAADDSCAMQPRPQPADEPAAASSSVSAVTADADGTALVSTFSVPAAPADLQAMAMAEPPLAAAGAIRQARGKSYEVAPESPAGPPAATERLPSTVMDGPLAIEEARNLQADVLAMSNTDTLTAVAGVEASVAGLPVPISHLQLPPAVEGQALAVLQKDRVAAEGSPLAREEQRPTNAERQVPSGVTATADALQESRGSAVSPGAGLNLLGVDMQGMREDARPPPVAQSEEAAVEVYHPPTAAGTGPPLGPLQTQAAAGCAAWVHVEQPVAPLVKEEAEEAAVGQELGAEYRLSTELGTDGLDLPMTSAAVEPPPAPLQLAVFAAEPGAPPPAVFTEAPTAAEDAALLTGLPTMEMGMTPFAVADSALDGVQPALAWQQMMLGMGLGMEMGMGLPAAASDNQRLPLGAEAEMPSMPLPLEHPSLDVSLLPAPLPGVVEAVQAPHATAALDQLQGQHYEDITGPSQSWHIRVNEGQQSAGAAERRLRGWPRGRPRGRGTKRRLASAGWAGDDPDDEDWCETHDGAGAVRRGPQPKNKRARTRARSPPAAAAARAPPLAREDSVPVHAKHLPPGYRWRKYGEKVIEGKRRSYFRCTFKNCPVRLKAEWSRRLDGAIAGTDAGTDGIAVAGGDADAEADIGPALLLWCDGEHNHAPQLPSSSASTRPRVSYKVQQVAVIGGDERKLRDELELLQRRQTQLQQLLQNRQHKQQKQKQRRRRQHSAESAEAAEVGEATAAATEDDRGTNDGALNDGWEIDLGENIDLDLDLDQDFHLGTESTVRRVDQGVHLGADGDVESSAAAGGADYCLYGGVAIGEEDFDEAMQERLGADLDELLRFNAAVAIHDASGHLGGLTEADYGQAVGAAVHASVAADGGWEGLQLERGLLAGNSRVNAGRGATALLATGGEGADEGYAGSEGGNGDVSSKAQRRACGWAANDGPTKGYPACADSLQATTELLPPLPPALGLLHRPDEADIDAFVEALAAANGGYNGLQALRPAGAVGAVGGFAAALAVGFGKGEPAGLREQIAPWYVMSGEEEELPYIALGLPI